MTLRRVIADLICTAEEQWLMDMQVSGLYFPSHADMDENGHTISTVVVEVSGIELNQKYRIKPMKAN